MRRSMGSFNLEISDDILDEARIPPDERESVLKRELAVQLYARELLPKAAARRLSGLDRVAFDDLLGQRGILSRLRVEDFDEDLTNLASQEAIVDLHSRGIATTHLIDGQLVRIHPDGRREDLGSVPSL